MFGFGAARKTAVILLETARAVVDRYDNLPEADARARLIEDERKLDFDGRGATYNVDGLPDFEFMTDLRNPPGYGSFTTVFGRNQYEGLTLSAGKESSWIAAIGDGLRGPAKRGAIKLAKALERHGALYIDNDALLTRRPFR